MAEPFARLFKRDWLVLAGIVTVTALLALPALTYPLGRDQGEFATIARGILNGRVPYVDLWNPKPPAVFYVYALAMRLLGQTAMALRIIDFIVVPMCCGCLFWLGRCLSQRRAGAWAALLFPVFYFTESFWTLTQNDGIVLVPMLLSLVLTLQVVVHRPAGSTRLLIGAAFLAGALAGYSVWYKYPFALYGVFLAVTYVWLRWLKRSMTPFGRQDGFVMAAYIVGGVTTLGGGALLLMAQGAWGEFLLSAQVTAQYTALTFNPQDFGQLMGSAFGFRWDHWGALIVLALIGAAGYPGAKASAASLSYPDYAKRSFSRSAALGVVLAWLATALAIMLVQAKGYDYHWLPVLPPLALLGAWGIGRLTAWASRLVNPVITSALVLVVLLGILAAGIWPVSWRYLSGQEDQAAYFGRFVAGEFVADESLAVSNLLRERVVPGDSLYIWGFRPEVYYLSGLNPATRFIFQFPLVGSWYPPQWREQNVDTLWAALPPYVLVLQVDYMPWVTGSNQDSNTLLQEYTELNNWLIFNYERETQIGNFFVWRRKQP